MGFIGPEKSGLLEQLGVELDRVENVKADASKRTNIPKVFTAGDMTRGQSLIVWAIAEGRQAARGIDRIPDGELRPPRTAGTRPACAAIWMTRRLDPGTPIRAPGHKPRSTTMGTQVGGD